MSGDVWHELERRGPEAIVVAGVELRRGSRVRLHPADKRDIFAAALDGRTGVVESIEELVDGGVCLAVAAHDDPGRDLGAARPGHRFFFAPDEVEPLARILVAGIGNIFLGDDGFGCHVVQRLLQEPVPAGVDIVDYGIRGFDLAYALASGYQAAVLVDAAPLAKAPGTLLVLEPPAIDDGDTEIDTHGMDPVRVLRLARELGGVPARTLVLACQPERVIDPDAADEVVDELSATVRHAVEAALPAVRTLITELLHDEPRGGPDER
jgi:hydrogenase maturation protease